MFQSLPERVSFPEFELEVLEFWKQRRIYEKSLAQRAGAPKFVFYEGPPTANGMPHPGHCLTRAIKDVFPRYRTMRGFLCERKAGWDTHGLPVEVEVCKELKIHSKEEIEAYGIEPFIHKCQESVWRYMQEWERLTERLGFWIHLDEAYVTYHQSFVESVWWSLKQLFERGLLYQGHKIVWWWAQGGTALSGHEVGLGYREVADPSVYVKFPLLKDDGSSTGKSLLVWTTTPWTLPSNQFAAVHPELEYATVLEPESGERLVVAAALVETLAGKAKSDLQVESTCKGADLIGCRYQPPFDYYFATLGHATGMLRGNGSEHRAWRVVAADFVTIDSGTGVVHQAPAFGEVDYDVLIAEQSRFVEDEGPELICCVGPDGKFTADAPSYAGRWVKECDKDISRELKERGLLFHQEQYLHEYPFCWRAEQDPLIQYPRQSWFIRTTAFRDQMLANNRQINWLPEHIRDGRFGNFLESNIDWSLSRERYWGTPLPIWVCEQTGKMEAVANYAELLAKPGVKGQEVWAAAKKAKPSLPDDLSVHKPYIDAVTYDSPFAPGARMRRVTEVIDCWYDSGAMPFAQWGYPQQNRERFFEQFPADFISEALDQTRGWFYSQLAISTMLFGEDPPGVAAKSAAGAKEAPRTPWPHPFKNCIVLGLMLAEWWESKDGKQRFLSEDEALATLGKGNFVHRVGKMSKQLRNYRSPFEIFNSYGADALRWYFFANQAPWNSIIYSDSAIKASIPEFLLRLWNCYSFFVIYANIDGFDPGPRLSGNVGSLDRDTLAKARGYRPVRERSELDRWIMGELAQTTAEVVKSMDAYDNYAACIRLNAFVDSLSNWWLRRSRPRFWPEEKEGLDKIDAYFTLYECLVTTCRLIAPFTPFLAETMWRNLVGVFGDRANESVHLCDYPTANTAAVDRELSARMELLREIASLGLKVRMDSKLKVRQPLAKVEVVLADPAHQAWLEEHDGLLRDELNVKQIDYTREAEKYITYAVQPNFKKLGPQLGKLLPEMKGLLGKADGAALLKSLREQGAVEFQTSGGPVKITSEDLQVRLSAKPGWAAADSKHCVVVLSTEVTPELLYESWANDVTRLIQDRRKALACKYTARISVGLVTESKEFEEAMRKHAESIANETLAVQFRFEPVPDAIGEEHEVGGHKLTLYVLVVEG